MLTMAACAAIGGAATPALASAASGGAITTASKALDVTSAAYTATPPTAGAQESDGQTNRYTLGGTWLRQLDPDNVGIADGWWKYTTSTAGWSEVSMPNSFNAGNLSYASFIGSIGWYRRDFTLPAKAFANYVPNAARSWVVQFENVNYFAKVWLNGHLIGTHAGASIGFEFPLKYLKSGDNQLVVRVSNQLNNQTFPPTYPQTLWWNFGGILDAVYIRPVARADIDKVLIRTPISCATCAATINETATIVNRSAQRQKVSLIGHYGSAKLNFGTTTIAPGATWRPSASVVIAHPRLWAPGHAQLYNATLQLNDSKGRKLAGYSYESGIRHIAVRNGLMYVNWRQTHLRGVAMHEQTQSSGAALSLAAMQQLMSWAQGTHATLIREHYPLNPEMEEMADQDGIMLWSEVPVYHPTIADQASASWRVTAVNEVLADINANQDHPSILVWSFGNELNSPPVPGQSQYIAAAAKAAHQADPTRPVGMALIGTPWYCSKEYDVLDVIGVNTYNGWFQANGTDVNIAGLGPKLNTIRSCYPNQAIFITEIGYGGVENGSVAQKGTFQNQDWSINYAFNVINTKPWLSGAVYWILQDWDSAPWWDGTDPLGTAPVVDKGLINVDGVKKPSYSLITKIFGATAQLGATQK